MDLSHAIVTTSTAVFRNALLILGERKNRDHWESNHYLYFYASYLLFYRSYRALEAVGTFLLGRASESGRNGKSRR